MSPLLALLACDNKATDTDTAADTAVSPAGELGPADRTQYTRG